MVIFRNDLFGSSQQPGSTTPTPSSSSSAVPVPRLSPAVPAADVRSKPVPQPVLSIEAIKVLTVMETALPGAFHDAVVEWTKAGTDGRKPVWDAVRGAVHPSRSAETRRRACVVAGMLSLKPPAGTDVVPAGDRDAAEALFGCIGSDDADLALNSILVLREMNGRNPEFQFKDRLTAAAEQLLRSPKVELVMAGMDGLTQLQVTGKAEDIIAAWERYADVAQVADRATHDLLLLMILIERRRLEVKEPSLSKWRLLTFSTKAAEDNAAAFGKDIAKWRQYWATVTAQQSAGDGKVPIKDPAP